MKNASSREGGFVSHSGWMSVCQRHHRNIGHLPFRETAHPLHALQLPSTHLHLTYSEEKSMQMLRFRVSEKGIFETRIFNKESSYLRNQFQQQQRADLSENGILACSIIGRKLLGNVLFRKEPQKMKKYFMFYPETISTWTRFSLLSPHYDDR